MKNRLTCELAVCGFNAVKAVVETHPDTINRFFLREDRMQVFSGICKQLAARKRPYKITDNEELAVICKTLHHQGVVAMIQRPEVQPLSLDDLAFWAREGKTGVVLHEVNNDHNLGAAVRSAAFFDAHFLVISERDKESALTTSAYRVAEGGMEHVALRSVYRTESFLRDASRHILTVGAALRSRRRIGELRGLLAEWKPARGQEPEREAPPDGARFDSGRPDGARPDRARPDWARPDRIRPGIALVFGNEETGLPAVVEEACSVLLRIPGSGNIESLSVSHAVSVFLNEIFA